jgi:GNAT superfamily N-acetyltransferase
VSEGERTEVTRTYLEMTSPSDLVVAKTEQPGVRTERVRGCPPSFFRYLYAEVGRKYHWVDRLPWTEEQVQARIADPAVSLHVLYVDGSPAGYFELERHGDRSCEVAYFGLLPEFLGRGLGKHLLTVAAETAWAGGAQRVWLHTCTLDDPAALPNYVARGFRPFKTEVYWIENEAPRQSRNHDVKHSYSSRDKDTPA